MSINERFAEIIQKKNLTITQVANILGKTEGYVRKLLRPNESFGIEPIKSILISFKDINPTWLIIGEGGMFIDIDLKAETDTKNISTSVPYEFVQQLFYERKNHDEKEMELLAQNRDLIELLKNKIGNIEKTLTQVVQGATATCADVSGTDVKK